MALRLPLRGVADERAAGSFSALYQAQRLGMVRLAAFLVGDLHVAETVLSRS